jgi:hypothetical protein
MMCFTFLYDDNGSFELRGWVYLNDGETTNKWYNATNDYEYSGATGIYTVVVNEMPCYIKLTDTGFVFCDVSGNTVSELPVALR